MDGYQASMSQPTNLDDRPTNCGRAGPLAVASSSLVNHGMPRTVLSFSFFFDVTTLFLIVDDDNVKYINGHY